jgi:hypothetical protein
MIAQQTLVPALPLLWIRVQNRRAIRFALWTHRRRRKLLQRSQWSQRRDFAVVIFTTPLTTERAAPADI